MISDLQFFHGRKPRRGWRWLADVHEIDVVTPAFEEPLVPFMSWRPGDSDDLRIGSLPVGKTTVKVLLVPPSRRKQRQILGYLRAGKPRKLKIRGSDGTDLELAMARPSTYRQVPDRFSVELTLELFGPVTIRDRRRKR